MTLTRDEIVARLGEDAIASAEAPRDKSIQDWRQ